MRTFLIRTCLFFILVPVLGYSQSTAKITGTVIDSSTGTPVSDVAVILQGTQSGTYTKENGKFSLSEIYAGRYLLQLSHVGYHTEEISVNIVEGSPVHLFISLIPRKYQFSPVTVTGTTNNPGTIVLDRESIQRSNSSTLDNLLQQYSGVTQASGTGAGSKSIRIRGSSTNQVLVLLDGLPLNDPLTGEVNLENIPTGDIDHLTITPHGSSAEYGAGAFSGIIRIFSQPHPLEKASLGLTIGSFGERSVRPGLNGTFGDWNYSLYMQDRFIQRNYPYTFQLPDGTIQSRNRSNADLHQQSAQSSLEYVGANQSISFRAHYLEAHRGLPGKVYFWSPDARASENRLGITGHYRRTFRKSNLQFQVSADDANSHYVNKPTNNQSLIPAYDTEYSHSTIRSKLEFNFNQSEHFTWKLDGLGQYTGFDQAGAGTEFSTPINAAQHRVSVGGSLHFTFPDISNWQIALQPSLRVSEVVLKNQHNKESYSFFSHSLLVTFHRITAPEVQLYVREDRSFRPPTFGDLYFQDFRVSGNPGLKPEKVNEYTAGASLASHGVIKSTLSFEAFWKHVNDQIFWSVGSYANFTPQNTDSRITGQSVQFHWQIFSNKLFGQFYAEHLTPTNLGSNPATRNKFLPFRPEYEIQSSYGLRLYQCTIQYFHRFRGKQFITAANTKSLEGYGVADFSISTEQRLTGLLDALKIRPELQVNNLWDKKYEVVARMPEPGRNYKISLNLIYEPVQNFTEK